MTGVQGLVQQLQSVDDAAVAPRAGVIVVVDHVLDLHLAADLLVPGIRVMDTMIVLRTVRLAGKLVVI